jgi:hypothetical protein
VRLKIWVVDPNHMGGRGGRSRGPFVKTDHGATDPQWPPVPVYELTDLQGGGAVPLASGRPTVFRVRRVVQPGEHRGSTRLAGRARRNEQRVFYLADLLGVERWKLGFSGDDLRTVTRRGPQTYPGDVAAARERVEAAYRDVVAKLVERELLDPQKAPQAPRLKVEVVDRRSDKSVALPPLEGVETRLE